MDNSWGNSSDFGTVLRAILGALWDQGWENSFDSSFGNSVQFRGTLDSSGQFRGKVLDDFG